MIISGVQKTTFVDYPGKVATTLFLAGCNFRCPFCHNRNLVLNDKWLEKISPDEIFKFLKKRLKYIQAVCITGGEPLIYKDLPDFIAKLKKMGLAIKLDTNGTNPRMLQELYDKKSLDYVALDIKSSLDKYDQASGVEVDKEKIETSIKMIMDSGIDYEFRSTILPRFHDKYEIEKMAKMIKGAKLYYLQDFVPQNTLDKSFMNEPSFTHDEINEFVKTASRYVEKCERR